MFKKINLTIIFTLALVLIIAGTASASDNYTYGTIGYGDPMFNFSGAQRFGNLGVEFAVGVRPYPGILDYPCPGWDYTIIDDYYYSALVGIDLLRYVDIGENTSVYAGAGLYLLGYDTVAESNVTYWTYRQNTTFEGCFAFSGGLQFHPEGFGVGIGFHSIRGVNLQMIFKM
jgi:hypothetical protein